MASTPSTATGGAVSVQTGCFDSAGIGKSQTGGRRATLSSRTAVTPAPCAAVGGLVQTERTARTRAADSIVQRAIRTRAAGSTIGAIAARAARLNNGRSRITGAACSRRRIAGHTAGAGRAPRAASTAADAAARSGRGVCVTGRVGGRSCSCSSTTSTTSSANPVGYARSRRTGGTATAAVGHRARLIGITAGDGRDIRSGIATRAARGSIATQARTAAAAAAAGTATATSRFCAVGGVDDVRRIRGALIRAGAARGAIGARAARCTRSTRSAREIDVAHEITPPRELFYLCFALSLSVAHQSPAVRVAASAIQMKYAPELNSTISA